jgi:hypothetical protein
MATIASSGTITNDSFRSTEAAWSNFRRPAKINRIGFLHLPDEVRQRIYALAVFDHDRGIVFLPRALPRKVTPDQDEAAEYVEQDNEVYARMIEVETTAEEHDEAGGYWTNGERLDCVSNSVASVSGGEEDTCSDDDAGYAATELSSYCKLLNDDYTCEDCLDNITE